MHFDRLEYSLSCVLDPPLNHPTNEAANNNLALSACHVLQATALISGHSLLVWRFFCFLNNLMRWLSRRFAWKEVCGVEPSEACCAENLCVGILGYVDLNNDLTKRPSSIQKGVRAGCSFAPAASDQRWSRILLNKLLSNITYILIHISVSTQP